MELLEITSNWLCSKPVKTCAFVRFLQSDLDKTEDIETLLENSDNCVNLYVPDDCADEDKNCKISLNVLQDESGMLLQFPKISSLSILCSSKLIEIHGNHTEYLATLTNEFIDESEDILMYRNDYVLSETQQQLTLTFKTGKNCKDMWIYALLINLKSTHEQNNTLSSKDMFMAMSAAVDTNCFPQNSVGFGFLLNKFSNILKTSVDSAKQGNTCEESAENLDVNKLSRESNTNDDKCLAANNASIDKQCSLELNTNTDTLNEMRRYIDKKFNDLENKIDNKLETLENRLIKHIDTVFSECQKMGKI